MQVLVLSARTIKPRELPKVTLVIFLQQELVRVIEKWLSEVNYLQTVQVLCNHEVGLLIDLGLHKIATSIVS